MKNLYLPALTGKVGNWVYYQAIIRIGNIVENFGSEATPDYRIKTVDEVEEIYSRRGISQMLQRVFDESRLLPIKNYLLNQGDKYLNNLTVAIFGGDPDWIPVDFTHADFINMSEAEQEEFEKSYGVIKLRGDETLFVLDGQHRVKGLRAAVKENPNLKEDTIAVTFIIHTDSDEGRERTRRLFTTVNRYAKPISRGESILLDEDDLSAIIVRKLIEEYPLFKGKNIIAQNKNANFTKKDKDKFSTVIELWTINELIIDAKSIYPPYEGSGNDLVKVRPSDKEIDKWTNFIFKYWDLFFEQFPIAKKFIDTGDISLKDKSELFSVRPIGQTVYCYLYKRLKSMGKINEINKYTALIPEYLNDQFWHYVLYNPFTHNILQNESFAKNYLFYMLSIPSEKKGSNKKLLDDYRKKIQNDDATLPKPLIQEQLLFKS